MFKFKKEETENLTSIVNPYDFISSIEIANKNLFDNAHDLYLSSLSDSTSYEDFRQYILSKIKDLDEGDRKMLLYDLEKAATHGIARNETKTISFSFGIVGVLILTSIIVLDFIAITSPNENTGINLIAIIDSPPTTFDGHEVLSNIFFGVFILFSIYCMVVIFTELHRDAREQLAHSDAINSKYAFYKALADIIRITIE